MSITKMTPDGKIETIDDIKKYRFVVESHIALKEMSEELEKMTKKIDEVRLKLHKAGQLGEADYPIYNISMKEVDSVARFLSWQARVTETAIEFMDAKYFLKSLK